VKRHQIKNAGLTAFALSFSCSVHSVSADFVYTWTIAPELWGQVEQKTITFDIPAVEGEGSPTLYNIEITAVQFNPQLNFNITPSVFGLAIHEPEPWSGSILWAGWYPDGGSPPDPTVFGTLGGASMGSLAFEGAGPGESGTFSDLYNPCSGLGLTGSGLWTTTIWRSSLAGGFPLTTGFEIKYYFTNVPAPPAMFLSLMIPLGGRRRRA
jgi:hypothetical protein